MSTESALIQPLLDQLRAGDASAISRLTELTYERLRRLAGKMLNQSFGAVGKHHELDSVLNNTYLRLHDALTKMAAEAKVPPTPADFFRFAAFKVRQVLLDMVGKDRRLHARQLAAFDGAGDQSGWVPPPWWQDRGPSPDAQANWVGLLDKIAELPDPERDVFEMHFVMDIPQSDIARELGLEPKQVSRLWLKAAAAIGKYLPA